MAQVTDYLSSGFGFLSCGARGPSRACGLVRTVPRAVVPAGRLAGGENCC